MSESHGVRRGDVLSGLAPRFRVTDNGSGVAQGGISPACFHRGQLASRTTQEPPFMFRGRLLGSQTKCFSFKGRKEEDEVRVWL